ncbi:hypothetical protein [Prochlorococcus sp. MIT 1223]|uniref:hypothetical protein n=1 Tax=Prochlorococcus sp. MIT 1223 TaxID=3096217 RepID=UPI002A74D657|nr:hypothetical protein [Prochlorococcus sp. MIT 1223]
MLADATINNPIFLTLMILIVWFAPGIIARRIAEKRFIDSKLEEQAKKISKLYPKKNLKLDNQ